MRDLDAFVGAGGSLAMLADIDLLDVKALYEDANRLYKKGDVAGAQYLYHLVVTLDSWDFDGWLSLGICHQRFGGHDQALLCFAKAAAIDFRDPRPSYLAGQSYLSTHRLADASKALRAAVRWAGTTLVHAPVREAASAALARIEKSRSKGVDD